MRLPAALCCLALALVLAAGPVRAGEYDLEIPQAEKKFWELGGYAEGRYLGHLTRSGSALGRVKLGRDDSQLLQGGRAQLQLRGSLGVDRARFHFLTNFQYQDNLEESEARAQVYAGYLSLRPNSNLTFDLGKKVNLWGKGYAWNPAGFISRPKDPDEPEANLEGYLGLELEYVKSLPRPDLSNLALTVVALPVWEWENSTLGDPGDVDLAAKAYFLFYDTDIDLMFFSGPDQHTRLGADFSRNLKENLEIHGEVAVDLDAWKKTLDNNGKMKLVQENQVGFLVGLRYLTASETTFIAEYYHNGSGYSHGAAAEFYGRENGYWDLYQSTGDSKYRDLARKTSSALMSQKNYGRDYLYLRIIQKEPLSILYSSIWLTAVVNLGDISLSLSPGGSYMLTDNLELNARAVFPLGGDRTEFGEKLDTIRVEVYLRYYF